MSHTPSAGLHVLYDAVWWSLSASPNRYRRGRLETGCRTGCLDGMTGTLTGKGGGGTAPKGDPVTVASSIGPCRTVVASKWLKSGWRKSPPHRPPRDFQMVPRKPHTSVAVVLAGVSATRRSTAIDGHRECKEFETSGLTSACRAGERWPLMTKSPGQRSPWAEKI